MKGTISSQSYLVKVHIHFISYKKFPAMILAVVNRHAFFRYLDDKKIVVAGYGQEAYGRVAFPY